EHLAARERAARGRGRNVQGAAEELLQGLGRLPREAQIRRGRRADYRRPVALRRLLAHEGRLPRARRRHVEPRALGCRDRRAPGRATRAQDLNSGLRARQRGLGAFGTGVVLVLFVAGGYYVYKYVVEPDTIAAAG